MDLMALPIDTDSGRQATYGRASRGMSRSWVGQGRAWRGGGSGSAGTNTRAGLGTVAAPRLILGRHNTTLGFVGHLSASVGARTTQRAAAAVSSTAAGLRATQC